MRTPTRALALTLLVALTTFAAGCADVTPPSAPEPQRQLTDLVIDSDPFLLEPIDVTAVPPVLLLPTPPIPFREVSAGQYHSCGVSAATNAAHCWGHNSNGQLGDGTTTTRLTEVPVAGGLQFRQLSAGYAHTCGVTGAYVAYCWGSNGSGQLGDGTTTQRLTPVPVAGGLPFRQVSAGAFHTCGVTIYNTTFCWGYNAFGQLGNGTALNRVTPTPVAGGLPTRVVSAGFYHTCAVNVYTSQAHCWGYNSSGQLGDATTTTRLVPVPVYGGLQFRNISAGGFHSCASGLSASSGVFCWGLNSSGQLGNGTTLNRVVPTLVFGSYAFVDVDAGYAHSCATTAYARALCWGNNVYGQLGDGSTTNRLTPVPVASVLSFDTPSAGGWHSGAATSASTGAYFWGYNGAGQVGDGTTANRLAPTPVAP